MCDVTWCDICYTCANESTAYRIFLCCKLCAAFVVTTQIFANYSCANGYWGALWTCTVAVKTETPRTMNCRAFTFSHHWHHIQKYLNNPIVYSTSLCLRCDWMTMSTDYILLPWRFGTYLIFWTKGWWNLIWRFVCPTANPPNLILRQIFWPYGIIMKQMLNTACFLPIVVGKAALHTT